jgi:hypothetical protein
VAQGYEVVGHDPGGDVVLVRGSNYQSSGWDLTWALLSCGLWLIVIAVKVAVAQRRVVVVAPNGGVRSAEGTEAPAWAVVALLLTVGSLGLMVATVFGRLVAAIAVPLGIVLLNRQSQS